MRWKKKAKRIIDEYLDSLKEDFQAETSVKLLKVKILKFYLIDFLRNNNPHFFKTRLITGFSKILKPRKLWFRRKSI